MKIEREIFKEVPEYEGLYSVSNFGNIKSLQRQVRCRGGHRTVKERILKPIIGSHGYYMVNLSLNGKLKAFMIHQLVAMTFMNHKPNGHKICVDHIDYNPLNNNVNNLQLISNRENLSKDQFRHNRSSKYTGVSLNRQKYKLADGTIKIYNYWKAQIRINGKQVRLGLFKTQEEAHQAYQNKLEEISK